MTFFKCISMQLNNGMLSQRLWSPNISTITAQITGIISSYVVNMLCLSHCCTLCPYPFYPWSNLYNLNFLGKLIRNIWLIQYIQTNKYIQTTFKAHTKNTFRLLAFLQWCLKTILNTALNFWYLLIVSCPLSVLELPPGWEKIEDPVYGVYYVE